MERYPKGVKGFLDNLRDTESVEFFKVYARLQPREQKVAVESKKLVIVLNQVDASPTATAFGRRADTYRDVRQLPVDGGE